MINVGIVGSTGYAGQQLTHLLYNHKNVCVKFLSSHSYSGTHYKNVYPQYIDYIESICISTDNAYNELSNIDLLFLALPHGKSFELVKEAYSKGIKIIDLGADYRLNNPNIYKEWYDLNNECSHLLNKSVYGLPELYREKIIDSNLIANPGCYPTASILALAPLLKNNIIDTKSVIIDAKSGVSGAGRKNTLATHFPECNESIKAYKVASHRHTPEIEQILSEQSSKKLKLSFTPHLVPMNRGILATCYTNMNKNKNISQKQVYELYENFYNNEKFIRITEEIPETRWVKGSNICNIGIKVDKRTNRIIVVSAIDNLIKGAAGQAIQNMNIMFNINETEGLEILPISI